MFNLLSSACYQLHAWVETITAQFVLFTLFCKQMETLRKAWSDNDPEGSTVLPTLPKPGFAGWLLSCCQHNIAICLLSYWFCVRQQCEVIGTSNWGGLTMGGSPLGVKAVKERSRRKASSWRMFYAMSALSAITKQSLPRQVGWPKTCINLSPLLNLSMALFAIVSNFHHQWNFLSFLKMTFHGYWCWTYVKKYTCSSLIFTWQCLCHLKKCVYSGPHTCRCLQLSLCFSVSYNLPIC